MGSSMFASPPAEAGSSARSRATASSPLRCRKSGTADLQALPANKMASESLELSGKSEIFAEFLYCMFASPRACGGFAHVPQLLAGACCRAGRDRSAYRTRFGGQRAVAECDDHQHVAQGSAA